MNYQPNFSDPRVIKKASLALTFVEQYTRPNQVSAIASTQLTKHFGTYSSDLRHWLVKTLLEVADAHYNIHTGQCKKYRQSATGVQQVRELLGNPAPTVSEQCQQQLDTGEFDYSEKSDRLFNPLQFVPRTQRTTLLASNGYRYQYDIEAAAPTMLLQRAQQLNPNIAAAALNHYINNRSDVRSQIARECRTSEENIKFIINAILQGGHVSSYSESKIFQKLNYDYDLITRLKHNELLTEIHADMKCVWKTLRSEFQLGTYVDSTGKTRSNRITGKHKSAYYRDLENQVGKVIRRELNKQQVRVFWIHDGWYCNKFVDSNQLAQRVRVQLGFVIRLDMTIYEN